MGHFEVILGLSWGFPGVTLGSSCGYVWSVFHVGSFSVTTIVRMKNRVRPLPCSLTRMVQVPDTVWHGFRQLMRIYSARGKTWETTLKRITCGPSGPSFNLDWNKTLKAKQHEHRNNEDRANHQIAFQPDATRTTTLRSGQISSRSTRASSTIPQTPRQSQTFRNLPLSGKCVISLSLSRDSWFSLSLSLYMLCSLSLSLSISLSPFP